MPQRSDRGRRDEHRQQSHARSEFRRLEIPVKDVIVELDVIVHDLAIREVGGDQYLAGLVLKGTGIHVRDFRLGSVAAYEQVKAMAASVATKVVALNQCERAYDGDEAMAGMIATMLAGIEKTKASIAAALGITGPVAVCLALWQFHAEHFMLTIADRSEEHKNAPTVALGAVEIQFPDESPPRFFRPISRQEDIWLGIENPRRCLTVVGISGKIGKDTVGGHIEIVMKSRRTGNVTECAVVAREGAVYLAEKVNYSAGETENFPKPASLIPVRHAKTGGDQMARALENAALETDQMDPIKRILERAMVNRPPAPEDKPEPAALESEADADGDSEPQTLVVEEEPNVDAAAMMQEQYDTAFAEANPPKELTPEKPMRPGAKKRGEKGQSPVSEVDDGEPVHVVPGHREIGGAHREKVKPRQAAVGGHTK